ncbi:MAG: 16S rRNA (guanine(966)-N(2))-methyltransferase RsmD [Flavobacteriales bacterium]|nr:MAG: 16S rRNA (guanine(966)-N(2))-methyltransferase RsmD [Flavobacteriales bacterium]
MRVIGGKYRNRRIHPPAGTDARPTTDFAKEGLFNVLRNSVPLEGIRVLDLFAGTGNMSLEFLSQGADEVISVESDRKLFDFMQRTARELGETRWRMVKGDAFSFLAGHRGQYDIIFADPPFAMEGIERIPTLVQQAGSLGTEGLLIVEHSERVSLAHLPGFQRQRSYGLVQFSFFAPLPATNPASA